MGTPDLAAHILRALLTADQDYYEVIAVVSQPDRPVGRKRVLTPTPTKAVALEYGIPVLQPEKIREIQAELTELAPDLLITAAYGQIIPEAILQIPQYKPINVHGSLLPKYRGGAPIQYAIKNGDAETGITIMYMEKKMDAGAMLYQKAIPIEQTDTSATMFAKLQQLGAEMLLEMLPDFFANKITPIKQDEQLVTFSPTIKKEECEIDWTQPATTIFNHVRAFSPAPTTYSQLGATTIKIYAVSVLEESAPDTVAAGTIISATNKGCHVATGAGVIALEDIQISGKKRGTISEIMNGAGRNLLVEGARFEKE